MVWIFLILDEFFGLMNCLFDFMLQKLQFLWMNYLKYYCHYYYAYLALLRDLCIFSGVREQCVRSALQV